MMNLAETSEDLEELWESFWYKKDRRARSQLAEHYLYLVRVVVGRMLYRLPSHIERADLEQVGVIGLLQALDRFQPGRGARFETYALARIRGAIIDYLRSFDPLTRQERRGVKDVIRAWQRLENEGNVDPSLEELSQELGIPLDEIIWLVERERSSFFLSLEEEKERAGEREERVSFNPEEVLENRELVAYLGRLVDALPEREKLMLTLYYFEGLTLKEIGRVLGVGESRVSQILTRVLAKLRVKIEEWEGQEDGNEKKP